MKSTLSPPADVQLTFKQLVDLVKKLPATKKKKLAAILTEEEEYISKEEVLEGIREGLQDVKLYREGKIQLRTLEDFLNDV